MGEQTVPHRPSIDKKVNSPAVGPVQVGLSGKSLVPQLSLLQPERKDFSIHLLPQGLHQSGGRVLAEWIIGQKLSLVEELKSGLGIGQSSLGQDFTDMP